MSKSKQAEKEIRLSDKAKESRPIEVLLATLCSFAQQGRDEVSLSELQESIAEIQRDIPELGYAYSSRFLYSLDVLDDLRKLHHSGYVRLYNYRHDSFLPKRFLSLTPLGKGRGCKVLDMLSEDDISSLKKSVAKAIENYKLRWRLWSR